MTVSQKKTVKYRIEYRNVRNPVTNTIKTARDDFYKKKHSGDY